VPIYQINPTETLANTFTIYNAASADEAMRDFSDATLLECPSAFVGEATFGWGDWIAPPGAVVRQFQPVVRYEPHAAGYSTKPQLRMIIDGVPQAVQDLPVLSGRDYGVTPPFVGAYSPATINGLQMYLDGRIGIGTGYTNARFFRAWIEILYVIRPGVSVTGPSGTLRVNNPTITWRYEGALDATSGQTGYRVRVYDVATPNVLAYDSGVVDGAAGSHTVGPLALQHTYTAVVNVRQNTSGVDQWSYESSNTQTTFTLDVNGPTVAITAPTNNAVVGTTSPRIAWTHTAGAGAQTGQTYYRVRAFNAADRTTALYDTGVVAGSASSAVIGPLDGDIAWHVTVATAQTTYGVAQWSPDAAVDFTIDADPALVASITATARDSTGGIELLVTRDTATPLWLTIDVEASYDGGASWQAVRGATHMSVTGDTAIVTDYAAPNEVPVQYRARATRVSAGETITGPWVLSNVATWHIEGNDVWLKDPAHPARSMRVCLSALPELLYDRVVGVFRPIGARYPVVISDVLQAFSATASVLTSTQLEGARFLELVEAPVLLAQSPPMPWGWGSRYVALGAVQQTRTGPTSHSAVRIWTVTMTEVDKPADETAT
jgi:hypothetical protein